MLTAKSVFILFAIELEKGIDMADDKEKVREAINLLRSKIDNNIWELTDEEFRIVDEAYAFIN